MARNKTNIDKVVEFMEQSPVCQVLVMQAIDEYSKLIISQKEELLKTMKNPLIHPQQWINCAENWSNRQLQEMIAEEDWHCPEIGDGEVPDSLEDVEDDEEPDYYDKLEPC